MSRGVQRCRLDGNHTEILNGLREWGAAAHSTAALGNGFPDIAASYAGVTVLFEVKDPAQPLSKRRLTTDESKFRLGWKGALFTVETVQDACFCMKSAVEGKI